MQKNTVIAEISTAICQFKKIRFLVNMDKTVRDIISGEKFRFEEISEIEFALEKKNHFKISVFIRRFKIHYLRKTVKKLKSNRKEKEEKT